MRVIATTKADDVNLDDLDALDVLLKEMTEEAGYTSDLVQFVAHMVAILRTGNDVILFEQAL